MPHATHEPRRILTSDVPHAPVKRRRSRFEQQALLTVAVSLTMLVIVGLYAASFRSRQAALLASVNQPRWSLLDDSLLGGARPMRDELVNVKETLKRLVSAGQTQVQVAAILKAKVEARASSSEASAKEGAASGTPETSGPAETPETP